jgi:hypothetical protein
MTTPGTTTANCESGAHHESGHILVAAVQGLRLKPEGIMVDPSGWGLACYHEAPDDTDKSRERNILAVSAGFAVEKRLREERRYLPREFMDVSLNRDNVVARTLLTKLAGEYWTNESRLREQLDRLIEEHWLVTKTLASVLLAKHWEPIRPLKSGCRWSHPGETVAKYLGTDELARVLAEHAIAIEVSEFFDQC